MKRVFLLIVIFISGESSGQGKNWVAGLTVTQGVNHMLIRSGNQESMPGYSYDVQLFYRYQKRGSGIFMEPALWFGKNSLRARATNDVHMNMSQFGVGIQASGGLMVSESAFLKVGILGCAPSYPLLEVVSASGMHLGHSAFQENFRPRPFLAAMTLGVGGSPGDSRVVEIHLTVHQYLTPNLYEPYVLDALPTGETEVYNAKALTTVVLAGITFKFVKPRNREME